MTAPLPRAFPGRGVMWQLVAGSPGDDLVNAMRVHRVEMKPRSAQVWECCPPLMCPGLLSSESFRISVSISLLTFCDC